MHEKNRAKIEIVRKSCYLKCNILLKYLVKRVIIVALISGKKMGRISLQSSKTTSCTNREIVHDFFRARVHARYLPWFRTLSETCSAKKVFFISHGLKKVVFDHSMRDLPHSVVASNVLINFKSWSLCSLIGHCTTNTVLWHSNHTFIWQRDCTEQNTDFHQVEFRD